MSGITTPDLEVKVKDIAKDTMTVGRDKETGVLYLGPYRPQKRRDFPPVIECVCTDRQLPASHLNFEILEHGEEEAAVKEATIIVKPAKEGRFAAEENRGYFLHLTIKGREVKAELDKVREGQRGFGRILVYKKESQSFAEISPEEIKKIDWLGIYCQPIERGLALLDIAQAGREAIIRKLEREVKNLMVAERNAPYTAIGSDYRNP